MGGSVENYLGFDWQPPSVFYGSQAGGYPPFASTNGPGVTFAGVNNGSGHYVGHLYLYMRELATGIVSLYLDIGTTILNPTFGFSSTGFSLPVGYEIAGFVLVNDADQTQVFLRWLWTAVSSSAPVISASLQQNSLDVTVPVSVTNLAVSYVFPSTTFLGPGSQGPYTYTIDYNDGATDSFTTSSITHTFVHTYLDTTPKTIKVQTSTTGTPTMSDDFNRPDSTISLNGGSISWSTTLPLSSGSSRWGIASNQARMFDVTNNGGVAYTATGNPYGVLSADHSDSNISQDPGIVFWLTFGAECAPNRMQFYELSRVNLRKWAVDSLGNSSVVVMATWNPLGGSLTGTLSATLSPGQLIAYPSGGTTTTVNMTSEIASDRMGMFVELINFAGSPPDTSSFDNWSWTPDLTGISNLYSNIVLLYPTWVIGSAINNSTRTAFI